MSHYNNRRQNQNFRSGYNQHFSPNNNNNRNQRDYVEEEPNYNLPQRNRDDNGNRPPPRFNNSRQRNPPPPARNQGLPPPVEKAGPSLEAKHVSTTTTAEKNDPMILNGVLIAGLQGYAEVHQERKFATDMSGFNQLLRTSYEIQTEEADRALISSLTGANQ